MSEIKDKVSELRKCSEQLTNLYNEIYTDIKQNSYSKDELAFIFTIIDSIGFQIKETGNSLETLTNHFMDTIY